MSKNNSKKGFHSSATPTNTLIIHLNMKQIIYIFNFFFFLIGYLHLQLIDKFP